MSQRPSHLDAWAFLLRFTLPAALSWAAVGIIPAYSPSTAQQFRCSLAALPGRMGRRQAEPGGPEAPDVPRAPASAADPPAPVDVRVLRAVLKLGASGILTGPPGPVEPSARGPAGPASLHVKVSV